MTDDELESHFFKHSNGGLFEYIGRIEMENTRVFVEYSLGGMITVFSIHEFTDCEDNTTEAVLSKINEEGKTVRDAVYSSFKHIMTSELSEHTSSGDDQVPLVYAIIKDYPSPEPLKKTEFEKNITEVHNENGQIILWTEPFRYDQALYIINAYPPFERGGSFESDVTFLRDYVFSINRAWEKNINRDYWVFLQEQAKILRNNLDTIDQDFWAKITFLPYLAARYSNYKMMYNRDKLIYLQEFPFAKVAENEKKGIIFKIHNEDFDDSEEFQEMLLDHIDYVHEKIKTGNDQLKEYRVLYQNIISDFDMLYFSLGAAIGIFYILFTRVFRWAINRSGIDRYIPKHIQQCVLQILGYGVVALGISLLIYDLYVIENLLSQHQYEIAVSSGLEYDTGTFYVILLFISSIVLVVALVDRFRKKTKEGCGECQYSDVCEGPTSDDRHQR
jgi:hypothetical protein